MIPYNQLPGVVAVAVVHLCSLSLLGQTTQQNLQETYQLAIQKTSEEILIDGKLQEAVWKSANVADNFWMSFPFDGQRVADNIQTEVMVTYDDNFIYIAAICHDDAQHIIPSRKRDTPEFWRGDAFGVVIDPVNERTNGFVFGVNVAGVQTESLITGQTGRRGDNRPGREPTGINRAWDNKWYSEVTTHNDQWIVELAIPFKTLRFDPGKMVWGINLIRGEPRTNSYHTWSPVPVQFRGVDLGFTGALTWDQPPGNVKSNISVIPYILGSTVKDFEEDTPNELKAEAGVDAKIAVTSSLNLDITVNPDFSQVDVDQQVTNLTAFSIRFPERRLFFLENSDLFQNFGIPPMRPFFSRRIGLDEDGNALPILYGARLSGNLNKNLRLGLMNLQTQASEAGPAQNYTSLAVHQQVLARSVIRGYFHNRQAMEDGEFQGDNYNRNAGLEFNFQSQDGKWRAFGGYGMAFSDGISTNNCFYNVGVGYDSRNISAYTNTAGVGNNYYADMGFIPLIDHYDAVRDTFIHVGFQHQFSRFSYTIYPDNPKVISHVFSLRNVLDMRNNWNMIKDNFEAGYQINFENTSNVSVAYNIDDVNLLFPFSFTDEGEPLPAANYDYNSVEMRYRSDLRKVLSFDGGFQYGGFYNGRLMQLDLGLRYRVQPWGNFDLRFTLSDLDFPGIYGNEQLFLISPRTEINFTRNLFWTTFFQYNTQKDNFNINSRLQWRFQPMSDLFIVYSDNYAVEFWGPKNRALVVKMNYWLNL